MNRSFFFSLLLACCSALSLCANTPSPRHSSIRIAASPPYNAGALYAVTLSLTNAKHVPLALESARLHTNDAPIHLIEPTNEAAGRATMRLYAATEGSVVLQATVNGADIYAFYDDFADYTNNGAPLSLRWIASSGAKTKRTALGGTAITGTKTPGALVTKDRSFADYRAETHMRAIKTDREEGECILIGMRADAALNGIFFALFTDGTWTLTRREKGAEKARFATGTNAAFAPYAWHTISYSIVGHSPVEIIAHVDAVEYARVTIDDAQAPSSGALYVGGYSAEIAEAKISEIARITAAVVAPPVATLSHSNSCIVSEAFTLAVEVDKPFFYYRTGHGAYTKMERLSGSIPFFEGRTRSGMSRFQYYTSDGAHTSETNLLSFTLDLTPPKIFISPPPLTTNDSFTLTLRVDKGKGYWSGDGERFEEFDSNGAEIVMEKPDAGFEGTATVVYYAANGPYVTATNKALYSFIPSFSKDSFNSILGVQSSEGLSRSAVIGANKDIAIALSLTSTNRVIEVDVYDIFGTLLRTLRVSEETFDPGYKFLYWDGANRYGDLVESGMYRLALRVDNRIPLMGNMLVMLTRKREPY